MLITQEMFNTFPIKGGKKVCPEGDYSTLSVIAEPCTFTHARFSGRTTFHAECEFSPLCALSGDLTFYAPATFGGSCKFSGAIKFAAKSRFANNCEFKGRMIYGDDTYFGSYIRMYGQLRIGNRATFEDGCLVISEVTSTWEMLIVGEYAKFGKNTTISEFKGKAEFGSGSRQLTYTTIGETMGIPDNLKEQQ